MLKLTNIQLGRIEDSIVIHTLTFPDENRREAWINGLLSYIDCKYTQVEYGADIEQYSFMWNEHMFILTVSDTLESVWINASHNNSQLIHKLYVELSEKI